MDMDAHSEWQLRERLQNHKQADAPVTELHRARLDHIPSLLVATEPKGLTQTMRLSSVHS